MDNSRKEAQTRFFHALIELSGLKPDETVLEVGCGDGPLAALLAGYLDRKGRYEGFDVEPRRIQRCIQAVGNRYPNFHFQVADLVNTRYNPHGKSTAAQYRFPYDNQTFDFVFLASVFTHMLPPDMEHYFSEISRVLKSGKKCLITFFLLNPESQQLMDSGKSRLDFKYAFDKYRIIDKQTPEAAICYDQSFILNCFEKYWLQPDLPVRYGSWCGRSDFLSYQDIIVATKK